MQLGVTELGDLNYDCLGAGERACPAATAAGTSPVGIRYVPLNTDGTAGGCLCEGWGIADAASGLSGWANEALGNGNITAAGLVATPTTAVVTTEIADPARPGYALRVVHDYHPSDVSPFLYEVTVTVTNTGSSRVGDLRYRRVMDWDAEPTAQEEWVTIARTASSVQLLFDSDNGFASSDPLAARGYRESQAACGSAYAGVCEFTALGTGGVYPAATTASDHGALFDFGFGALAPGQTRVFQAYYGAAPSRAIAAAAAAVQGIGVYSLAFPDCGANGHTTGLCAGVAALGGVTEGTPNTFTFGFMTADADLAVAAPAPTVSVEAGAQGTASYAVTNRGPNATPDARLTIPVPAGVELVSATPSQGSCTYSAPSLACRLGELPERRRRRGRRRDDGPGARAVHAAGVHLDAGQRRRRLEQHRVGVARGGRARLGAVGADSLQGAGRAAHAVVVRAAVSCARPAAAA